MSKIDAAIREKVRHRGYTPAAREAATVVALLATKDEEEAEDVERALLRLGAAALPALFAAAGEADPPMRGRVCRTIGRLSPGSDAARAFLVSALDDADAKTRRNAVIALGKLKDAPAEEALLLAWGKETRTDHKRSIVEALGKTGGPRALAALRDVETDDPELLRILDRARLMLERTALRGEARGYDAIVPTRAPAAPVALLLHCRAGLESILLGELPPVLAARVVSPGVVRATLRTPLADLFAARTWQGVGFPLPQEWLRDGAVVEDAVARALSSAEARAVLATWNVGKVRYRIAWRDGGHKRATVWRAARRIGAVLPDLVNDPTESAWEVVVGVKGRFVDVELVPRALIDPRFAYRVADVPAASHPTIAAALARLAGARADDVVWDPFVGSGTELVERARLGPYARLIGTDVDPRALEAAAMNLASAEVLDATLVQGDATIYAPGAAPTLVITNPPMGRRLARGEGALAALVDRFLHHVGEVLAPEGRVVWASPMPRRSLERARESKLSVESAEDVDMGGFTAQFQVLRRARATSSRR